MVSFQKPGENFSKFPSERVVLQNCFEEMVQMYKRTLDVPEIPGVYSHIPLELLILLSSLRIAHSINPGARRFLDVGAGMGTSMMIAYHIGYKTKGIEKNQALVDIYNKNFIHYNKIECIDAFDYDKYDWADIILIYQPIKDIKTEIKLEQSIIDKSKRGTFFIIVRDVLKRTKNPYPEKLEQYSTFVFRKTSDKL